AAVSLSEPLTIATITSAKAGRPTPVKRNPDIPLKKFSPAW
ncbi:hypothetical protein D039_2865B, partial [Vibrio parahaemolyticus EKP-028]